MLMDYLAARGLQWNYEIMVKDVWASVSCAIVRYCLAKESYEFDIKIKQNKKGISTSL